MDEPSGLPAQSFVWLRFALTHRSSSFTASFNSSSSGVAPTVRSSRYYTNLGIHSGVQDVPQTRLVFYREVDGSVPVKQWLEELKHTDRRGSRSVSSESSGSPRSVTSFAGPTRISSGMGSTNFALVAGPSTTGFCIFSAARESQCLPTV